MTTGFSNREAGRGGGPCFPGDVRYEGRGRGGDGGRSGAAAGQSAPGGGQRPSGDAGRAAPPVPSRLRPRRPRRAGATSSPCGAPLWAERGGTEGRRQCAEGERLPAPRPRPGPASALGAGPWGAEGAGDPGVPCEKGRGSPGGSGAAGRGSGALGAFREALAAAGGNRRCSQSC